MIKKCILVDFLKFQSSWIAMLYKKYTKDGDKYKKTHLKPKVALVKPEIRLQEKQSMELLRGRHNLHLYKLSQEIMNYSSSHYRILLLMRTLNLKFLTLIITGLHYIRL